MAANWQIHLKNAGYVLLSSTFSGAQIDEMVRKLDQAFATNTDGSTLRAENGSIYGARNLLENMLTLRLHLDDMTEENGPLKVVPGSHHSGKAMISGDGSPVSILGRRGDVLLMRPLLSHCSNKSAEATKRHRRILHYEFAGL